MIGFFRNLLLKKGDSFFGNSAVYLFSNILGAAVPFVLLPILTRHLTQAEYGVIGMYQMSLAIFSVFTGLSVHGAANRKYYDRDEGLDLAAYISGCVQIIMVATSIMLVLVYLLQGQLVEWTGVDPQWLMIAVLASGGIHMGMLRLGQWQVRNKSFSYGFFQISQSILNLGLSLWLVVFMSAGLEGRLWGQSIPPIVFGIAALYLLFRADLLKIVWRPDYIRHALSFGIPLVPHMVGMFMLSMFDRMIIKHFLGLEQIGIYMVAIQLAMGVAIIVDAINKAYMPWLYERLKQNDTETNKRIVYGTYVYFVIALLIALMVAYIAPWFVPWFAGEEYAAAGPLLSILIFGLAFVGMYTMVGSYIFYSERTGSLSVITFLSGAMHLLLVYYLVPTNGIKGAAIASLISASTRFLMTWVVAQRLHPMPWMSTISGKIRNYG